MAVRRGDAEADVVRDDDNVQYDKLGKRPRAPRPHACSLFFQGYVCVMLSMLVVVMIPVNYVLFTRRGDLNNIIDTTAKMTSDVWDTRGPRILTLVDRVLNLAEVATDVNATTLGEVRQELSEVLELLAEADVQEAYLAAADFFRTTGPAVQSAARGLLNVINRGSLLFNTISHSMSEP